MTSTIIRTKTDRYYGRATGHRLIKITDTVLATMRAIGRGQITVAHVLWAINSQLDESEHLTEAQVRRALNELCRYRDDLTRKGHGIYRWE